MFLKCWNGLYGCSAFTIEAWQTNFRNINEAGCFYKGIWGHCWVEDESGKVLQKF